MMATTPKGLTRWLRKHLNIDENEAYTEKQKARMWLSDYQLFNGRAVTRGFKMSRDEGMDYGPGSARRRNKALRRMRIAKQSRKRNRR